MTHLAPTPGRSLRIRTVPFPLPPPRRTDRFLGGNGLRCGEPAHPGPSCLTRFVCLGAEVCLNGLPPHPASRRRPCLWLRLAPPLPGGTFHPPSNCPCRSYPAGGSLRSPSSGAPLAQPSLSPTRVPLPSRPCLDSASESALRARWHSSWQRAPTELRDLRLRQSRRSLWILPRDSSSRQHTTDPHGATLTYGRRGAQSRGYVGGGVVGPGAQHR